MDGYRAICADYAATVLKDGGQQAVVRGMGNLSDQVEVHAPVLDGDLRGSGHPKVTQGGRVLADRAPRVARLSEAQLKAKSRARYPMLPDRLKGWIWWHVQHHTKPPPRRKGRP